MIPQHLRILAVVSTTECTDFYTNKLCMVDGLLYASQLLAYRAGEREER